MQEETALAFRSETSESFLYILETLKQLAVLLKKMPGLQSEEACWKELRCNRQRCGSSCRTLFYDSSATFCKIWCGKSTALLWCTMWYPDLSSSLDISFIEGYKKKPHIGWGKFFYLHPTRRFKNIFLEFGIYRNMFHFCSSGRREHFYPLSVRIYNPNISPLEGQWNAP